MPNPTPSIKTRVFDGTVETIICETCKKEFDQHMNARLKTSPNCPSCFHARLFPVVEKSWEDRQ